MKFSLMTLSLFLPIAVQHYFDKDEEDMRDNYIEMLDLIAESGYTAVDLMSTEVRLLGKEFVKKELAARNLKVACYIHMESFEGIENEQTAVDIAKFLGSEILMLAPGYTARYEGLSGQQIRDDVVKRWKPIVEYANASGIKVVVEETPDLRLHFCGSEEVKDVLNRIVGMRFVYDSANMLFANEDAIKFYNQFKDKTIHVHLKDLATVKYDKSAYLGDGLVNLKKIMHTLKGNNYDGYIAIEFTVNNTLGYKKSLEDTLKYAESL